MIARTGTTPSTDLAVTPAFGTPTDAVIASYTARASFARTETAAVPRPRLLSGVLTHATAETTAGAVDVAEIPCGAGHFLTDYARARSSVTLVDANPQMLAVARAHASDTGLPPHRTRAVRAYVQDLRLPSPVDLLVVPNAALNQLAGQTPLPALLGRLRANARAGGQLLVQAVCSHPGDTVDTAATFYDPARPHGVWFADRSFGPEHAGGAALRRRRQHRTGDRLRIEFDYHDLDGTTLHRTTVELAVFSADRVASALIAAGFTHVRYLPGQGGLSEFLATVDRPRP